MKKASPGAAIALAVLATPAMAADGSWSLGLTAGTLGVGPELGYRFGDHFGLRANAGFFSYDDEVEVDDINYDGELDLQSFGFMADWYPLGGRFRISVGGRINDSEIGITGSPATSVTIGDQVFTPAEIGTLSGTITTDDFMPMAAIGFGGQLRPGFTFGIEFGVVVQGSPKIENLRATGLLASDPGFLAELEEEERRVEKEAEDFEYWPVLQISFLYRF